VTDLLNAVINVLISMISTVWEARWFKGKSLAIMTSFFNRLFVILNLASVVALMIITMYFAIAKALQLDDQQEGCGLCLPRLDSLHYDGRAVLDSAPRHRS